MMMSFSKVIMKTRSGRSGRGKITVLVESRDQFIEHFFITKDYNSNFVGWLRSSKGIAVSVHIQLCL
jgi:hypothetical protein